MKEFQDDELNGTVQNWFVTFNKQPFFNNQSELMKQPRCNLWSAEFLIF